MQKGKKHNLWVMEPVCPVPDVRQQKIAIETYDRRELYPGFRSDVFLIGGEHPKIGHDDPTSVLLT